MDVAGVDAYLADCRALALQEIHEIIPKQERYRPILYDLMLEYPLRHAKALRPGLCIATCRALGGPLQAVLRSAAVLELYHNAFLIHDDVEDGSESRRDQPTLHGLHGTPIAVNVGDAMLALALQPLLDNMRLIGMGKALRVLQTIARMARESAEGQALELHWIRTSEWQLTDTDYLRMVYKKTSWYSFITPILIGGLVAGAAPAQVSQLRKFAALLGMAFQIQDDVLNLTGEGSDYGKEIAGDLWEGKRTLLLLHAMRTISPHERERAQSILAKPRPLAATGANGNGNGSGADCLTALLSALEQRGEISPAAHQAIAAALPHAPSGSDVKTPDDVQFLVKLMYRCGSVPYARRVGQRLAAKAKQMLDSATWLVPSVHREFLEGLVQFVTDRER